MVSRSFGWAVVNMQQEVVVESSEVINSLVNAVYDVIFVHKMKLLKHSKWLLFYTSYTRQDCRSIQRMLIL